MRLETVLDKVTDICREYSAMQTLDGHRLNELLKDLTGRLYYLETIRGDRDWETVFFASVNPQF